MEKIITTIVPQLLLKLSQDKSYHTQNDLSGYGFPLFLIKRIAFHLTKELSKEFTLPGKEWLNSNSDDLISEWIELQKIIKREIHLPAKFADEIIEKSVRDCVGMTIQPRKFIPELLFEGIDLLDSNQLTERSSVITVNRFLVWSMVRYMEKKGKKTLNVIDANRIIESIDDKIVENYNPLNWLSLVKPLFELSGSTVNTELFRLFFEHKGKNHLAKEFDLINGEIKESKFIEVLSSPDSMYVEGYKNDQQTLFREEIAEESTEEVHDGIELNEELAEAVDRQVEESEDQVPFHLAISEDPEEELTDDESDALVEETDEVLDSEIEKKAAKEEPNEEMIAPWDKDEEDSATLLDAYSEDDDLTTELEDYDDEDQVEIIQTESELTKKDQQIHDAAPLEIEDEDEAEAGEDDEIEEEALFNKFATAQEEDLNLEGSINKDESDALIYREAAALEVDSKSGDDEDIDEEDGKDEGDSSLINRFMFDDSDLEDPANTDKSDSNEKVKTIYDELNLVRSDAEPKTMDLFGSTDAVHSDSPSEIDFQDQTTDSETEDTGIIQKFSETGENDDQKDSDESDVPMWKSFLEREEEEVKSSFQFDDEEDVINVTDEDDSDEKLDEDGFIEEPIYDFTKKEPDLNEKIGDLSNWMQDVREKFIEELFGDSDDAYDQALSDIVEFDDWKNASRYIEKEIFTRNRIDVYDEIAVDFTDRLHSYFIENKS